MHTALRPVLKSRSTEQAEPFGCSRSRSSLATPADSTAACSCGYESSGRISVDLERVCLKQRLRLGKAARQPERSYPCVATVAPPIARKAQYLSTAVARGSASAVRFDQVRCSYPKEKTALVFCTDSCRIMPSESARTGALSTSVNDGLHTRQLQPCTHPARLADPAHLERRAGLGVCVSGGGGGGGGGLEKG